MQHPTYGWPSQPLAPPRSRSGPPGGMRHQLVIGLVLLTLGFLFGLTTSSRGLLAIGLAWVVVGFLARRRADGWREWVKGLVEYATVAALMFALFTAAPAPPAKAPARKHPPAAERTQADPWAEFRKKAEQLWTRAAAGAPEIRIPDRQGGR